MHPLARPENKSGALSMTAGERYYSKPHGCFVMVDEFLHDGDVLITTPEGKFDTVKWNELSTTWKAE
jgi:hypothetical protein